jgi:glycosyltransferase involved in cell wall biosynthesis
MGRFVEETVASAQSQTFRDFEIIVVDDGSDDPATVARLDQLAGTGITLLRTINRGVAEARNHGIQAAKGRYILPLDADDLIAADFLEKTVRLLEEDVETGIVCSNATLFGDVAGMRQLPEFSAQRLLTENLLFVSSLFRKSDWQLAGGYCSSMKYGWEDWEFWISVTRRSMKVVRIPEALLKYRIRTDSRDHSMFFWQKASMLLLIIARHFRWYLQSPISVVRLLTGILSSSYGISHDQSSTRAR